MVSIPMLLTAARAYGDATGLPDVTVSWRMFGDSKKLSALLDGGDIQVRRAERALAWLGENWPSDAVWPEGVSRPDDLHGGGFGVDDAEVVAPAEAAGAGAEPEKVQ